jgi:hypothetical protein
MGVLLDAVLRTHFAAEVIAAANRADIASEKICKNKIKLEDEEERIT